MSDQVTEFEFEELSLEECEEVGGGILWTAVLGAIITAINGGIAAGEAVDMLGDQTSSGGGGVSYPTGGFGSDIRLKTDIKEEGRIEHLGLTVYSWEYTNAPGERFVGVMAQDLLAREQLAHAVFTFHDGPFAGFYGVDYAALGLRCLPADAFDGDVASLIVSKDALATA